MNHVVMVCLKLMVTLGMKENFVRFGGGFNVNRNYLIKE